MLECNFETLSSEMNPWAWIGKKFWCSFKEKRASRSRGIGWKKGWSCVSLANLWRTLSGFWFFFSDWVKRKEQNSVESANTNKHDEFVPCSARKFDPVQKPVPSENAPGVPFEGTYFRKTVTASHCSQALFQLFQNCSTDLGQGSYPQERPGYFLSRLIYLQERSETGR